MIERGHEWTITAKNGSWTITVSNGRVVLDLSAESAFDLWANNTASWPISDALGDAADEARDWEDAHSG